MKSGFTERLDFTDNNNLTNDTVTVNGNAGGSAIAMKLQGLNRRVVAVVLAIAMVVSLLSIGAVFFITKGASTKEMIPFTRDANDELTYRITDGTKYVEGGTYYYEYDNRVYTYNLTENLPAGTVMTFNENNKNITWVTDGSYQRTMITSVNGVSVDAQNTDSGHATLNVSRANLTANTDYCYELGDGSYYIFQLPNSVTARRTASVRGTNNTEVQYTEGTLVLDFENETASFNGDTYSAHYLYVQADEFTSNEVYLIGVKGSATATAERLIAYDLSTSQNVTTKSFEDGTGWFDDEVTRKAYSYYSDSRFDSATPYAGESFTENRAFYDGEPLLGSSFNGNSKYALGEFRAVRSADSNAPGFYLKPINLSNDNAYADRALGHIYTTDDTNNVYVHDYQTIDLYYNGRSNGRCDEEFGNIWEYSNYNLINKQNAPADSGVFRYLKNGASNAKTKFQVTNSAGAGFVTLYKRQLTFIPESISFDGTGATYTNSPGSVSPTNVSYTENYTVEDNNLELNKTVTQIPAAEGDNDTFKVHLEAYTTEPTVKQPVTDIVLVMDTSNKMAEKLYDRQYKNLNTYTKFSPVSLSSRIHDDLFDGEMNDEDKNGMMQIINLLVGSASSAVFDNRNYISNRYVEDPNYPGTYVYLYQKYRQAGSIAGTIGYYTIGIGTPITNYYTYYFTSANGEEYSTTELTEDILTTVEGLVRRNHTINSLTFYKDGDTGNAPKSVSTIYQRAGTNKDNALNRTTSNFSNTGLYEISIDNSKGLYIRDNDGAYKRVRVTPVDKNLNTTSPNNAVLYKYTVDGTDYVMYQGSSQNGAQDSTHHPEYYGVYQGFRYYKPDPANPNKLIIDEERSLLSKSLYTLETDSTVTRLQALKEASEEFLLNVYKQSQKADINVGIVTYDAGATTRYQLGYLPDGTPADLSNANHIDQMISDIYNLTANTESRAATVDDGMANGKTEFDLRSAPDNRRFLLLFSGGVPADYTTIWAFRTWDTSSGDYDTTVASNAIKTAYTLKNNMNTTIYSVGLFENANEAESATYGHRYYYGLHPSTICNNEIGNSWGRTGMANYIMTNWANISIDPMDAAATNRMLGYISSDYATPQSVGLSRYSGGLGFWNRTNPGLDYFGNWYYLFSAGGPGYKITNRYSKTDSNHYFGISPATVNEEGGEGEEGSDVTVVGADPAEVIARFKTVFDTLIAETSVPSNELDEDAKLLDGITEYFKLKPETVEAYSLTSTDGGETWGNKDTATVTYSAYPDTEAALTEDTKTLIATMHNYKQFYVQPGREGKKLVLEFEIERIDDLIGGNNIPTNLNNSGIYDGNPLNNPLLGTLGVLEEKFEVPKVDLSIIDIDTIAADQSAYYGCEADLQDMVNPAWVNGKNNEFVNMEYTFYDPDGTEVSTYTVPAGYSEGTWDPQVDSAEATSARFAQMLESSEYEVHLRVIPATSGTVGTRDDFDPDNARVYVFTPHYDVHNDEVENAGDLYKAGATSAQDKYLSDIPVLGDWELDMNGIDTEGMTEQQIAAMQEEAEELLAFKQEPDVDYGLKNVTENTDVENKDALYPIPAKTVFEMQNIMVTPTPLPYLARNVVTGYTYLSGSGDNQRLVGVQTLDVDGQTVISTIWYDSNGNVTDTPQSYDTRTELRGDVTRYHTRADVDATAKTSVTNTDDHNENKQFTINLKSHDVMIVNHTTGEQGSDYSDPNRQFPLTFTLKDDSGDPVANETITYIDAAGDTQTATTNSNGQIVISMKDADTVTLKEIRDGYTLAITSTPPPGDLYELYAQAGPDADHLNEVDVDVDTETTDEITIGDDMLIDLIHHIGDIPVTLLGNADSKLNPFFIAAAVLTVLGGTGIAFMVKRKRETSPE